MKKVGVRNYVLFTSDGDVVSNMDMLAVIKMASGAIKEIKTQLISEIVDV